MQSTFPLDNMQPFRERSASFTGEERRAAEPPPGIQQPGEDHCLLDPHLHSAAQKRPIFDIHPTPPDGDRPSAFHAWWQELVLSAYAVGLFIAITVILSCFNNRTQPSWTFGLNLNTLIALLATFMRSGIGMIIEQVLSQAKWTWQQRPRPLRDMASFDEASRGPWGSLTLWFKLSLRHGRSYISRYTTSALAATIVTVLSLAIGSFTQQAVKSVVCNVEKPGPNVSLPIGFGNPSTIMIRPGAGLWDLDASVKARVYNALSGSSYDRSILIDGCPTGNCTFPESAPGRTLSTAGFCSKCIDTSSLLRENVSRVGEMMRLNEVYLPNGLKVGPFGIPSYTGTLLDVSVSTNSSRMSIGPQQDSEISQIAKVSALTVHLLALTVADCDGPYGEGTSQKWNCSYPALGFNKTEINSATSWNAVSATCDFYPCIQDIKAEISNARLEETVIDEVVLSNYSTTSDALGMYRWPCYIDGVRYDEHNISLAHWQNDIDEWTGNTTAGLPNQCRYRVPFTMFRSLQAGGWLADAFNGSCTMTNNLGYGQYARRWPLCEKWWLTELYNRGNATFDTISASMKDVATAITDSYRLASIGTLGVTNRNTVNGTVWETTICTQFKWPWLLFPASLLALTVLSLVLMMMSTASSVDHPPVWKSSILPLLYLQGATRSPEVLSHRVDDLKEISRIDFAQLERDDQMRWRLKRTEGAPTDSSI